MYTEEDGKAGLVKTNWQKIRERVKKVDHVFANIVDSLDPDNTFPLYLAYLPYGDLKGDTKSTLLPKIDGGYFRVSDPCTPKDVLKHLGYSRDGSPFGMVLDKEVEYFIDLKKEKISIPCGISKAGYFFSCSSYLSQKSTRSYAPNSVLTVTSGARSTFMLPNIGCAINHSYLQREFNISHSPPKSLYEHWYVFKEIVNSKVINSDWRSCLLYFSEKWIDRIYNDKRWLPLKLYLHEKAWNYFEYERCRYYYDVTFSVIQKERNLKPNPYLTDTAKHLFAIALGDSPGYAPAIDDNSLPLKTLQEVFVNVYGMKKYLPTIMKPSKFRYEDDDNPIYYSLQNPSTYNFSPKSRKITNTLLEMRELQHVMNVFTDELNKQSVMGADSVIGDVAKNIQFHFYHNKLDRHKVIKQSANLTKLDARYSAKKHFHKHTGSTFASDSPFLRGCVSIKAKC